MQYLILIYSDEKADATATKEEMEAWMGEYWAYTEAMQKAGAYKGGEALHPTSSTTTVRIRDGKLARLCAVPPRPRRYVSPYRSAGVCAQGLSPDAGLDSKSGRARFHSTAHCGPAGEYSINMDRYNRCHALSLACVPDLSLDQSDSAAPVYGFYATPRWTPGEIMREDYAVPLPNEQ